jgi:hypothetical protein
MYIAGRRRTGSRPLRTLMSFAVYPFAVDFFFALFVVTFFFVAFFVAFFFVAFF